jgi:uncharacterized membrane protein
MAKDLGDAIGTAVGRAAHDVARTVAANARKSTRGPLSGVKGVAAGAGLVALAPLAAKGVGKLVRGSNGASALKEKLSPGSLLPGGGDGKDEAPEGVGKGRRLPVQQAVDVAVPIDVAYNQWTQFEEWPTFMHRLQQVTQEDDTHVRFKTKIWGISREFNAEIVEQRPNERIKWRVTEGVTHTGVVTFHALADRLTRIEVTLDVQPGSLIEKAARGMRHVKRAVRADLARFKAYVEMQEEETGAWRGVIEDAEVKQRRQSNGSNRSRSRSSSSRSRSGSSSSRGQNGGGSSSSRSRSGSSSSSRSRSRSSGGPRSRPGS